MSEILAAMVAGAVLYRVLVGLVRLARFVRGADLRRAQAEDQAASVERRVAEADAHTALVSGALDLAVGEKHQALARVTALEADLAEVRRRLPRPNKKSEPTAPEKVTWTEGEPSWACQTCGHHNGRHADWCGKGVNQ